MRTRINVSATALLVACSFAGLSSTADPLHQFASEGAWRHEYSGWQFGKRVGDFTRVMAPYTIDGNNDVGVRYEHSVGAQQFAAVVEILSSGLRCA
jgi:hypothetical protein